MSGSWYDFEPPYTLEMRMGFVSPERREWLVCPDCGDVTTVDARLFASSMILGSQPPPICSRCGTTFLVLQRQ